MPLRYSRSAGGAIDLRVHLFDYGDMPIIISAIRVCLKKENPQVRVDFSSVQGINPKA